MVRWLGLDKYQKVEFRELFLDDLTEKKMTEGKRNSDFKTTTEKMLCVSIQMRTFEALLLKKKTSRNRIQLSQNESLMQLKHVTRWFPSTDPFFVPIFTFLKSM